MKRKRSLPFLLIVFALLATAVLARVEPVMALLAVHAPSATFTIVNQSIDGGGSLASSDGPFTLSSTIGQSDASTVQGASDLALAGGFWGPQYQASSTPTPIPTPVGGSDSGGNVYLPIVNN